MNVKELLASINSYHLGITEVVYFRVYFVQDEFVYERRMS